ncbi:glycosyltransferase family 2 protein [Nocardioides soli]|nr:glycosyltransferase [Nocardioides soli]
MAAPYFSILTPVYNPGVGVLQEMIDSVTAQSFTDWELVLVDDLSPDAGVRDVLRAAAAADSRIRVVERETNGGICAASNDAVDVARGEFLALLDHDDLLTADALKQMHAAIQREPEVDYLYSDEDKIDEDGNRFSLFRKPPWSPERFRAQMYTCHLSVLRASLVREVGAFRLGFDGSQDHDLVLRVTERARRVVHVPEVLYHWRAIASSTAASAEAKPYAVDARVRAVRDHLERTGIKATTYLEPRTGSVLLRRELDPDSLVSIVIPTRGTSRRVWGRTRVLVVEAVRSVLEKGGHENVELVVVHDESTPDGVLAELREVAGDRLKLVPYDAPFNFSEKCNLGVLAASGDLLVILNDDIELITDNFLPDLVGPILEPGVGLTGANLRFADTTAQHVGLVFKNCHVIHAFPRTALDDPGHFAALVINREVSGVTGACIAVTRETYERAGGMTETLPVNFNDVDFSLKIAHLGLRIVWVSTARAFHFESQTRVAKVEPWERDRLLRRWDIPRNDPYLPGVS